MNWFDEDRGLDDSDMLSPLEIVDPAAAEVDPELETPARELTASWSVKTDPGCDSDEDVDAQPHADDDDDGERSERDPDTGLSYDGTRRVYGLLCAMAHVDGRVAPAQRRELDEYQEYLGLSPFAARVLEDEACRSRSLRLGLRQVELDLLMAALIDMAAADGRISAKEERLLERVNERAGWSGDAIAEAAVRALERARSVQPVHAPDPVPQPAPAAAVAAIDTSGEDPFGLTIDAPALGLGLEDSGEGDLVLPEAAAPALALRGADPVLPPAPRASRSRSASASLAALAASDEAEAAPAPRASRRAKAAPRARRRAGAWR